MFQYIGELCRYLLHAPPSSNEKSHRSGWLRNGLSSEVWDSFKERFRIPQILEFYAATEVAFPYLMSKENGARSDIFGVLSASILAGVGAVRCGEKRTNSK